MADIYQFSQKSKMFMDNNIFPVLPQAKWQRLFPTWLDSPEEACMEDDEDDIPLSNYESVDHVEDKQNREPVEENLEDIKKIAAIIESMPTDKLDNLTAQRNYEQLLPKLAGNLTSPCIEIICEEILKSYAIPNETILLHFLPVYITRESCSTTLNLFIRCNKMYPDTTLTVMQSLFMNVEILSKQLVELFKAVDVTTRNQFLQAISINEIPTEVFVHQLNTIIYLLKNCKITFEVQNFILNGLQQSSERCKDDKNWGQCLLVFFEGLTEVTLRKVSKHTLEQLLVVHNTPFKKPCQVILRKLHKAECAGSS